ncbi:hypothetical protein CDL12_29662 [Handroanthus impetiginosus]|uniref:BED-type domain-containing protein n=1 Tax=Handroanthus impetiginosus TaxID=429701 RepID=A0A2G9FYA0_9LAMI|nr:hypothetical protein CDL12_29662 [Handroanthus impetiginosus]
MISQNAAMNNQQSDAAYDTTVSARPIAAAAWRGRFNIPSRNLDINISAHVSNIASLKVLEVASIMPESLCLEMVPRLDVWPASFKSSPPTEHSISLFFFLDGRDEERFESLLTDAMYTDVALKATIGKAKLLIFTSLQLPQKLHAFQGKLYFWGVFTGQEAVSSRQSDCRVDIQTTGTEQSNSGNHRTFDGKGNPVTTSSKHNPSTRAAKADRRGRRLDNAWEHAKPLDELRQKAECRYCGFVSSHGGISRLKAHLGGGHPSIRLPDCHKVPPEVKKVMADWFSEWSKCTKALWTKEIRDADKRRRPDDLAWEHAKPSDVADPKTQCKYFSFVSLHGETSQHKVHIDGRDPKMPMEAWPKVSPEIGHMSGRVKVLTPSMSHEMKGTMSEWVKNLTASRVKKSQAAGMQAEKRGRPLDNAWEHAKPLDEARQKTQCNYCGFVSQYGGISRLKAHLGGGCPQMQLQGCPQVPLEVKRVMEQWYSEWAKTSTAAWTRKSYGSAKPLKRGRPLDDTWEHAIPLDEMRQATRCKYCGFISKHGGIARLKLHLLGGDPTMQLQGCPNVSPDIKNLMARETKKCRKKSKGMPMEIAGGMFQDINRTANEMQWFEKRHHVLQETLDEIRNTSLKERIQQLLDEKNAKVQKMQFEIQSLKSQLASMP